MQYRRQRLAGHSRYLPVEKDGRERSIFAFGGGNSFEEWGDAARIIDDRRHDAADTRRAEPRRVLREMDGFVDGGRANVNENRDASIDALHHRFGDFLTLVGGLKRAFAGAAADDKGT